MLSIDCYVREFYHVSSLYLSIALKFPQQTPDAFPSFRINYSLNETSYVSFEKLYVNSFNKISNLRHVIAQNAYNMEAEWKTTGTRGREPRRGGKVG